MHNKISKYIAVSLIAITTAFSNDLQQHTEPKKSEREPCIYTYIESFSYNSEKTSELIKQQNLTLLDKSVSKFKNNPQIKKWLKKRNKCQKTSIDNEYAIAKATIMLCVNCVQTKTLQNITKLEKELEHLKVQTKDFGKELNNQLLTICDECEEAVNYFIEFLEEQYDRAIETPKNDENNALLKSKLI